MSQSSASVIFEDSQGFLWIGTENGLNKYDGTDFQIFEKSLNGITGLTDAYIVSIFEDLDGNLLIATRHGLNIYDRKLDIVKPYPFQAQGKNLQTKFINAIKRIDDFLWVGTNHSGLYRYNVITGETVNLTFETPQKHILEDNIVIDVFPLKHEQLLVVTQNSRYIIDCHMKIKERFQSTRLTRCALQVGPSEFLAGSEDGKLVRIHRLDNRWIESDLIHISPGYAILAMDKDDHGNIWLGSENYGLTIYSPTNGNTTLIKATDKKPNSISGNSIWSLYKATNGVMWIGYFKKGLSFFDPNYYKFKHIKKDPFNPQSLGNNIVNCFIEDPKGNIWIGTDGGGLNYWNRESGLFEQYSLDNGKLNSNVVLSILPDDQNRLWIGTWGKGLTIFDLRTMDAKVLNSENSPLASDYVRDLIKDKQGRIWIAAYNGRVQVYYPKTNNFIDVSVKSEIDGKEDNSVARLYCDRRNAIWVGTLTSGVYRLEENDKGWSSKQYHSLSECSVLSNNYVNTITEDTYGNVWVGTQAGLNKYLPKEDRFEAITRADGLKNDAINGIIQDEYGFLWLGTGQGIIRYDDRKGDFLNYDISDGLQGNEFVPGAYYWTKNQEMLFGGNNGFNIFTGKDAKKRADQPSVIISGLKIFNKTVKPNDTFGVLREDISLIDSIALRYNHSVINFEFKALTFRNTESVNYAYYLEGFEADWNYVGNRTTATYTNLDPGEYTLHIKSTNSDRVWNDKEKSLFITITPPIWKTWWFRTLLIASILLFTLIAYKIRLRSLKNYQTKLEREIDERTKELQLQKKKLMEAADELSAKNEEIQRFAYAVSHDLKSPLNNIKGIASLIPMEFGSEDTSEMEKYLELINISCEIMSDLIADITEIAKLGTIENKKEILDTNKIMHLASDLASGKVKAGNVKLNIQGDLPDIYGDRNRIIQVFGNLLDNSIKYMGDQSRPEIDVKGFHSGCSVRFEISDNGSGMDQKSLKKLFLPFQRFHSNVEGTGLGLFMIKKIVVSHDGQITANSQGAGHGSTFSVILPTLAYFKGQRIPDILEEIEL